MNRKGPIDIGPYKNRGYMGLANLGNTCFLNSCLQVLNHTYELNQIFLVNGLHKRYTKANQQDATHFVNEWVDLQRVIWGADEPGAVSPGRFVHNVQHLARIKGRDLFTGWAQNDMPEFLLFAIDTMHNSIARSVKMNITGKKESSRDSLAISCYKMLQTVYEKEYSEVMDLFYGIYVSIIRTPGDVGSAPFSQKPEMFFVLDLPIPSRINTDATITLYDCFDLFTTPETLDGENAWQNDKTGQKESVVKELTFWNLPKVLVIMLKRFHADGNRKRQDLVDFPLTGLNLSKYVCGYNSQSYVYDLYGVCNHMGGTMGGHYHCYVKNAKEEWLHFNDTHCGVIQPNSVITPSAYCLFYRMVAT
jgi:ubiquitin carboxyl-terminal hydrolase 8